MKFTSRPYREKADLDRLKSVLVEGRRASRHSGYTHVGDLEWVLFYDPDHKPRETTIRLWFDAAGDVAGWGRYQGSVYFEHHLLPDLRGSSFEEEIVRWCIDTVHAAGGPPLEDGPACATEIFEDDASTVTLLARLGFGPPKVTGLYFTQELDAVIAAPAPPEGFTARAMTTSADDVDGRAAAHYAAFSPGSRMTADAYRAFMSAPGYDAALDSIVQASDGRIAAYAMGWLDRDNLVGEFEPVGCRPEFRRLGLARAALVRGLLTMKDRGMATAIVYTNAENTAAAALYPSAGFELTNRFVTLSLPGTS